MLVLAFILTVLLPMILGSLIVAAIEGRTPVLRFIERIVIGFLVGMTVLTYAAFMGNAVAGLPFSLVGFLGTWVVLVLLAIVAAKFRGVLPMRRFTSSPSGSQNFEQSPLWARIIVWIFAASVLVRIIAGAMVLATTPPYYDDTLNNWNLRAKTYYVTQTYKLVLPTQHETDEPNSLSAYPPMVPLAKTFSADLAGTWSDGLVGLVHATWFIAVLILLWAFLRRFTNNMWALLGASTLGSLSLFITHGLNAYSDVAMTSHILPALALLFVAYHATDTQERMGLLRVSVLLAALFPFVKNEGLLLYLTTYILFLALSLWRLVITQRVTWKDVRNLAIFFASCLVVLVLPWLMFKWMHGMPFGNAKNVSGLTLGWHQGVLLAVTINTMFEGNWNIFFALFLILLVWKWKMAFRSPVVILTGFTLLLWFGQIMLFLMTSLATEALMQTGYARGLIHLVPIMVMATVLMLVKLLDAKRTSL